MWRARNAPAALRLQKELFYGVSLGLPGLPGGGSRTSYVSGRVQEAWETEEAGKEEQKQGQRRERGRRDQQAVRQIVISTRWTRRQRCADGKEGQILTADWGGQKPPFRGGDKRR